MIAFFSRVCYLHERFAFNVLRVHRTSRLGDNEGWIHVSYSSLFSRLTMSFHSLPYLHPGLRIKETKEVYEGEVTELTPTEAENPLSGYGKTVSHVVLGLKTVKGTKQLRLDPTIYESILKEKIVVGDVVYIDYATGAVKVSRKRAITRRRIPTPCLSMLCFLFLC